MSRHVCAHVSGWPAWFLTRVLRKHLGDALDRRDMPPTRRQQVLDAFHDLEAAADDWRTSASGNAETRDAETVAPSGSDDVLTTEEAAAMLNLTPRRVRQLGPIIGRKVGGSWQFNRTDLEIHRELT